MKIRYAGPFLDKTTNGTQHLNHNNCTETVFEDNSKKVKDVHDIDGTDKLYRPKALPPNKIIPCDYTTIRECPDTINTQRDATEDKSKEMKDLNTFISSSVLNTWYTTKFIRHLICNLPTRIIDIIGSKTWRLLIRLAYSPELLPKYVGNPHNNKVFLALVTALRSKRGWEALAKLERGVNHHGESSAADLLDVMNVLNEVLASLAFEPTTFTIPLLEDGASILSDSFHSKHYKTYRFDGGATAICDNFSSIRSAFSFMKLPTMHITDRVIGPNKLFETLRKGSNMSKDYPEHSKMHNMSLGQQASQPTATEAQLTHETESKDPTSSSSSAQSTSSDSEYDNGEINLLHKSPTLDKDMWHKDDVLQKLDPPRDGLRPCLQTFPGTYSNPFSPSLSPQSSISGSPSDIQIVYNNNNNISSSLSDSGQSCVESITSYSPSPNNSSSHSTSPVQSLNVISPPSSLNPELPVAPGLEETQQTFPSIEYTLTQHTINSSSSASNLLVTSDTSECCTEENPFAWSVEEAMQCEQSTFVMGTTMQYTCPLPSSSSYVISNSSPPFSLNPELPVAPGLEETQQTFPSTLTQHNINSSSSASNLSVTSDASECYADENPFGNAWSVEAIQCEQPTIQCEQPTFVMGTIT